MVNDLIIRRANKKDTARITEGLMLAMKDIVFEFIGNEDEEQVRTFFNFLVESEHNQYSYQNSFVAEKNQTVVGVVCLYDGALLHQLREPVIDYIRSNYGHTINPEDETQPGEIYIDCIGVLPEEQGNGIGSKLIEFVKEEFVSKHNKRLGLLVDKENSAAKKLYIKHGFESVGSKNLMGKAMEHLQFIPPFNTKQTK